MPWMPFGIRGPGGSSTGSVVAVAIGPLSCTGYPKALRAGLFKVSS
jgi:hypothetical protein